MNFQKWLKEYHKEFDVEFHRRFKENPRGIPNDISERTRELFIAYKMVQTNKKLVIATWVLAIASIILSIFTLMLK